MTSKAFSFNDCLTLQFIHLYADCSQCNLIWTQMSSPVQIKTCTKFGWSKYPPYWMCHSINQSSEWTRAVYTNSMTIQIGKTFKKYFHLGIFVLIAPTWSANWQYTYLYVCIILSANRILHRQNNWREIQMYSIVEICGALKLDGLMVLHLRGKKRREWDLMKDLLAFWMLPITNINQ